MLYDVVNNSTPSREALAYLLGILGVPPNDSWLEESAAELAPDFVAKVSDELRALDIEVDAMPPTAEAAIDRIIALRDEARRAKNWSASDKLRDALQRCGVELKDSKEGTTWSVTA